MTTYRRQLAEKRLDGNGDLRLLDHNDPPAILYDVLNFFEHVSLLVRRNHLDESDVWDTFGYWMLSVYGDGQGLITQDRKNDQTMYSDFVKLSSRLKVVESDSGGTSAEPSQQDISDFYGEEKQLAPGKPMRKRRLTKRATRDRTKPGLASPPSRPPDSGTL